jgi:hypothetical protein
MNRKQRNYVVECKLKGEDFDLEVFDELGLMDEERL